MIEERAEVKKAAIWPPRPGYICHPDIDTTFSGAIHRFLSNVILSSPLIRWVLRVLQFPYSRVSSKLGPVLSQYCFVNRLQCPKLISQSHGFVSITKSQQGSRGSVTWPAVMEYGKGCHVCNQCCPLLSLHLLYCCDIYPVPAEWSISTQVIILTGLKVIKALRYPHNSYHHRHNQNYLICVLTRGCNLHKKRSLGNVILQNFVGKSCEMPKSQWLKISERTLFQYSR